MCHLLLEWMRWLYICILFVVVTELKDWAATSLSRKSLLVCIIYILLALTFNKWTVPFTGKQRWFRSNPTSVWKRCEELSRRPEQHKSRRWASGQLKQRASFRLDPRFRLWKMTLQQFFLQKASRNSSNWAVQIRCLSLSYTSKVQVQIGNIAKDLSTVDYSWLWKNNTSSLGRFLELLSASQTQLTSREYCLWRDRWSPVPGVTCQCPPWSFSSRPLTPGP